MKYPARGSFSIGRSRWKDREIVFLVENYRNASVKWIADRLGRSPRALYSQKYRIFRENGFVTIGITGTYYKIITVNGDKYYADVEDNNCTCPRYFYNRMECKHLKGIKGRSNKVYRNKKV